MSQRFHINAHKYKSTYDPDTEDQSPTRCNNAINYLHDDSARKRNGENLLGFRRRRCTCLKFATVHRDRLKD